MSPMKNFPKVAWPSLLWIILQVATTTVKKHSLSGKVGFLHQSPNPIPETVCSVQPCTVLTCAWLCTAADGCVVFSHNPSNGSCVMSRRPVDGAMIQDSVNAAWNTYYRTCPEEDDYVLYESHQPPLCLRLIRQHLLQEDARALCRQQQTNLVRVKTLDTYNIVSNFLAAAGYANYVWVGAEDREVEGEFYWNDGTRLYQGTSLWLSSGEGYNGHEDCVCLSATHKLIDCGCWVPKPFVCQYDV